MPPSELGEIINFNVCRKRLPGVGVGSEVEWHRLYGLPGDVTDINKHPHTLCLNIFVHNDTEESVFCGILVTFWENLVDSLK